jgi:Protein of unknown function (DUF1353)
MNASKINRRDFSLSLLGASLCGASTITPCVAQSEVDDRKAFMQSAITLIAEEDKTSIAEFERLKALGGRPLLVRKPKILAFGDWDYFYLEGELGWRANSGQAHAPVTVPRGFVSDLASVPRIFWSILPKTGRYAYAAIVHDYLYWEQKLSREEADAVFKVAMTDSGVSDLATETLFRAVRVGGRAAWDENSKSKATGEKRILRKLPTDPLISWRDWRTKRGVF